MPNSDSRPSRSTSFSNRPKRTFSSSTRPHSGGTASDRRPAGTRPSSTGSRFVYPQREGQAGNSARGSYSSGGRSGGFSSNRSSGSNSYSRGGSSRGSGGRGRRPMATFDVSKFINLHPAPLTPDVPYTSTHTFKDFNLDLRIVEAIESMGIVTPSAIQDQVIQHIMEGTDVVGLAQTGTGKTAAFLIPTIHKTLRQPNRQTLILTPTRELAIQVEQELRRLTPKMHMYATVCVGGMNIRPQITGLKRKNHFIIGTPGRVQDLLDRGHIRPENITTVILDEADRMLDMGFIHDIKKILKDVPKERETLFFSATMSKTIEGLIHEFLRNPVTVSIKKDDITCSITQDVVRYEHHNKFDTLVNLLKTTDCSRAIIFGAMKHSVEKLSNELTAAGVKSDAIHGNKSHIQRQRALKRFKDGQIQVLVATDVAARGIHVDDVSHVINYDLPNTYEDYVHRIGRTGRGSKCGKALTFVAG